jgi:hypothetical protein
MGRRLTAAQLERRQKLVAAREKHYLDKVPSTLTTVKKREIESLVYASQAIKAGTSSALMKVQCSKAALAFFGGLAALGLRESSAVTDPVASKPRNFKPAQVHAMIATATPTASLSPWKTRVIKYSAATTGTSQAHYVAPISGSSAVVTYDNIDAKSSTIFNAIKGTLGNLDYARFYLTPEEFSNIKN